MNDSEKIIAAIQFKHPGAKFYISDGHLIWLDADINEPSQEQIDLWIAELKEPPNWERLLRESGPFVAKAQTTINTNGFTLLLSTLTHIRSVVYLEMALKQTRTAMRDPYTVNEIAALNQLLSDCNIELILN